MIGFIIRVGFVRLLSSSSFSEIVMCLGLLARDAEFDLNLLRISIKFLFFSFYFFIVWFWVLFLSNFGGIGFKCWMVLLCFNAFFYAID